MTGNHDRPHPYMSGTPRSWTGSRVHDQARDRCRNRPRNRGGDRNRALMQAVLEGTSQLVIRFNTEDRAQAREAVSRSMGLGADRSVLPVPDADVAEVRP